MSNVRRFARILFGGAVLLGVSLAVAGCGGATTSPKSTFEPKAEASSTPPSKSKTRGLAEGGDKTARERRAERQKTK